MNFKKIIKEEIDDFDWVKPIEAFYWDHKTNPLKLGDCIIDKLDSTSTNWVIEKLGQTMSGTKTITVSDGEQTKILNRELFEKDLVTGRYSFCEDFVTENFDWVDDVPEYHSVINQAFYFNPIALSNDSDYTKLIDYLESLGFESEYSTPRVLEHSNAVGVYAYRSKDGKLCYVYTSYDDEDEDYYMHIRGYAEGEADNPSGVVVVDARKFVKNLGSVNENFDWAQEWSDSLPDIGDEYYYDYGFDGPVLVMVIGLTQRRGTGEYNVRFEVLDEDFVQHHSELFYHEEDGWDPTDSTSLEGFIGQTTRV